MQDVQNVADNGSGALEPVTRTIGGYTITRVPNRAGRVLRTPNVSSFQNYLNKMIGEPVSAPGQKYGGFSTQAQLNAAILGGLEPLYQGADIALQHAADTQADIQARALERIPDIYGLEGPANITLTTDYTGQVRPINMLKFAAETPEMESAAAQLARAQAELARAEADAFAEIDRYGPARAEEARLLDYLNYNYPSPTETRQAEVARQDIRELRRVLPVTDATDVAGAQAAATDVARAQAALALASRNRTGQLRSQQMGIEEGVRQDIAREVTPYQELAGQIMATQPHEFARLLAEQRYGIAPEMAAGLYQPSMSVTLDREQRDYENMLMWNAVGMDPNATMEEDLLRTYGPEAVQAYRQNRMDQALFKIDEGARTAEEEQYDAAIEAQLGINPADVAVGDVSTARALLQDANFQAAFTNGINAMVSGEAMSIEDKKMIAREQAMNFYVSMLEAGAPQAQALTASEILLNSIIRFDFLNYAGG